MLCWRALESSHSTDLCKIALQHLHQEILPPDDMKRVLTISRSSTFPPLTALKQRCWQTPPCKLRLSLVMRIAVATLSSRFFFPQVISYPPIQISAQIGRSDKQKTPLPSHSRRIAFSTNTHTHAPDASFRQSHLLSNRRFL